MVGFIRLAMTAFCLICILSAAKPAFAEDNSLRYLSKARVEFEKIPPEAKRVGVDEHHIRASAELKLRQCGIEVVSPTDKKYEGCPYVLIDITALTCNTSKSSLVYSVDVSVRDYVLVGSEVKKHKSIPLKSFIVTPQQLRQGTAAALWSDSALGESSRLPDAVYQQVDLLLDSLVRDFKTCKNLVAKEKSK